MAVEIDSHRGVERLIEIEAWGIRTGNDHGTFAVLLAASEIARLETAPAKG